MARAAAEHLKVAPGDVLVASTGVIARPLPLDRVKQGILSISPSREGGLAFSQAILTTDGKPVRMTWQEIMDLNRDKPVAPPATSDLPYGIGVP